MEENNEKINSMLFSDTKDKKEQSTGEIAQMEKSIDNLNELLKTAKSKKTSLNPETESSIT